MTDECGGLVLEKPFIAYGLLVQTWFPTLFSTSLPFPTVLRLVDLLILDGPIVLIRTCLAMFHLQSKRIHSAQTLDQVLQCLLKPPMDELLAPDHVVKVMAKMNVDEKKVESIKTRALSNLGNRRRVT